MTKDSEELGTWREWSKWVTKEQERQGALIGQIFGLLAHCKEEEGRVVRDLSVQVGKLEIKASVWGAAAGLLGGIGTILVATALSLFKE